MMGVTVLCTKCKHWTSAIDSPSGVDTCPAFPDGIPPVYFSGVELHLEVDEEQRGSTVFEKRDDVDQETVDNVIDSFDMLGAADMVREMPDMGDI